MNEQSENCQVCCNSSFKQTKKLSPDISPYKCGICLRGFPKLSSLAKHVKLDDCRDSTINCNLCNESFDHPSLRLSHPPAQPSPCLMECTRPNKPNNCCNVILNNRNSKQSPCCKNSPLPKRRNQFVSGNNNNNMVNECFKTSTVSRRNTNGNVPRTKPFKCKICLKSFSKASVLANHTKSHTKDKSFKCDIYSKNTESANFTRYEDNHASGKVFSCNICHKGFSQSSNLTTHKRVHSGERPFQCYICNKAFTESGNRRRHMRIHSGERPFKCDICEKPFSQLSHVAKHKSTHFKMKHFKTKMHNSKNRMKANGNGTNKSNARPGRRRQVSSNVIKIYSPSGKLCYKCAICEKVFKESGNLTRHFRTHTGERPFHCSICYKSFSQASHVHKHMKTHSLDKPFSCELCPKSFSNFDSLYEHVKIHSGLDAEEQSKIDILTPDNIEETAVATVMALEESKDTLDAIKPIMLQPNYNVVSLQPDPTNGNIEDAGNQILIQEPLSQQYLNSNLPPELGLLPEVPNIPKSSSSSSVFECHICQKTFSQYCFLTRHSKIHLNLKPYKCKICDKAFTESGNLSRHMRIHSGERPYKCSVCSKAFSQATHLQKHMNTHTADKSHNCYFCQDSFKLSADLTKHVKSHSQDKQYQCHICSKVFTESGSLSRHMRIHSGSRPYQCEVCDKSFFQSCVLNKHKRIHLEDKPFKCDICKKAFTESGNLTRHYRTHTGEKPYRCNICNKPFSQASHVNKHMRTHSESQYLQQDFTSSTLLEGGDAYPNMSLIEEMMASTDAAASQEASVTPENLAAQYTDISRHIRFFADSKMCECTNCNSSITVSEYTEHITTCLASAPNTVKTDTNTSDQKQGNCVSEGGVTSDAEFNMKTALNDLNSQHENTTKENILPEDSNCIPDITDNGCNNNDDDDAGSTQLPVSVKTESM